MKSTNKRVLDPSIYQITVDGTVLHSTFPQMEDLEINHIKSKNKIISTFTSKIQDQSALNGLLNTLFNNNLKLISILKLI